MSTSNNEVTVEQRIFKALSPTQPRSMTALANKVGRPRVAKAKLEAALTGMVSAGAVAMIPPPALPEGAKRGRGRPAVAKFLGLIPAPVATEPATETTTTETPPQQ